MTALIGTQLFFLALLAALVARLTVSFWPAFGKAYAKTPAKDATDAAPVLLWHEAPDGQVTWANAPYLALMQTTQDVEGLTRLFGQETSGKQRRTVEVDGTIRWFDVDHSPHPNGRIGHAMPADTVVRLEQALGEMLQTMAKTFAHLPTGLAVFDRDRHLQLFNPALCDLTGLSPAFMSRRPSLNAVLDAMRDRKTVPEPADWKAWRRRLADMERAEANGQSVETWALPGGQTYRVAARPQPNGALVLLIDDISNEITRSRRHRADLELGQAVIDSLDDAIAVFSGSGHLVMSNAAYAAFWGHDPAGLVGDIGIRQLAEQWRGASAPTPVWSQAEDFVTLIEDRAPWQAEVRLADGRLIGCRVTPLSGGATMMAFHRAVPEPMPRAVGVAKGRRNG
ncbi:MAG: hypothetical protein RLZZ563_329 [Pseudomonadota bacterium]